MEKGQIKITATDNRNYSVQVELINENLWLSKWEMVELFNVFSQKIEGVLKSIFKEGLLKENEVSKIHSFTNKGKECIQILYNLETLIFVSFRISSLEAQAFRKWLMSSFSEQLNNDVKSPNVLIVLENKPKISKSNLLN